LVAKNYNTGLPGAQKVIRSATKNIEAELGFIPSPPSILESLGISMKEVYDAIEKVDPSTHFKASKPLVRLMNRLATKYKIGVLTDTTTSQARRILMALGLDSRVLPIVIGGDKVTNIKPDFEPFLTIAHELGEAPSSCVSIGDRVDIDLAPAKSLGMRTVLISRKAIESTFVDIAIRSVYQIEEALHRLEI
jgi:FMN phosphatase YigB (HAD superfamily)